MILDSNKGFRFFIITILLLFGEVSLIAKTRIAVLYSGYTEKYAENYSPKVIDQITVWELFLMQEKIPYEVIYDNNLESGITDDFDILILPSVYSISSDELKSMKKFLENGKSILTVGSKLNYDDSGNFVGEEYINELLGIESKEFTGEELSLFHYLNFNPIFNANSEFDGLLQISTKYAPMFCSIPLLKNTSLGYLKIKEENNLQTSLIYGLQGKGKFVWAGFNFNDVIGGKSDSEEFKSIIINSINWLNIKSEAWIYNYPDGKSSSTIILVENSSNLKPEFLDKLNQEGIDPYFMISSGQKISEKIKTMFKAENIILDLSNFTLSKDEPDQKLIDEITKVNAELGFTTESVLIPEYLIKNESILNSLTEIGVNIFLFPQSFSGLPSMFNNRFLLIPYCPENQINYNTGGINFLTYNSKIICDGNPENDFLDKVTQARSTNTWITDLHLLKDWWLEKNNITLSINSLNGNAVTLAISNKNPQEVNNINLILKCVGEIDFDQLSVNCEDEIIDYSMDKTGDMNLMINKINAHQTKKIDVIFNRD